MISTCTMSFKMMFQNEFTAKCPKKQKQTHDMKHIVTFRSGCGRKIPDVVYIYR